MKQISFISLIMILFQTTLFGSGFYGVMLENDALLCTCNHSAKNEVHPSSEDLAFKKNPHLAHTATKEKSLQPTCHSPKPGEPHLCSCKKANKKSEYLQSFLQNNYFKAQKQSLYPESITLFTINEDNTTMLSGYNPFQYRPPEAI